MKKNINYYMCHILIEHVSIDYYLHKLNIIKNNICCNCDSKETETVYHIIYHHHRYYSPKTGFISVLLSIESLNFKLTVYHP